LFLDIRKAYDCLNFKAFSIILKDIGIESKAHDVMMDYLSYATKVKDSLKIFIYNEEDDERRLYSRLPEQYTIVLKGLLDLWDKQPPGECRPAFAGHGHNTQGFAWFSCANELSRSWLVKAVEEVDKLVDGVLLSANPEDKFTEIIVVIPSDPDGSFSTITTVFKRLTEGPNHGLNTTKWTIFVP
jgi:hypothetical protein